MNRLYMDQILLAQRWDRCVDFGSPMSTWSAEMLATFTNGSTS